MPTANTADEVAALQARLMPRTARVGDPAEDASMAAARPALARINALGLATTGAQMGSAAQRAYVTGFASPALAAAVVAELDGPAGGGALALAFPHGEDVPPAVQRFGLARMPRLSLTYDGAGVRGRPATRQPLAAAQSFAEQWRNLLPETGLRGRTDARDAVRASGAVSLFFADPLWGRRTWLFRRLEAALRAARAAVATAESSAGGRGS